MAFPWSTLRPWLEEVLLPRPAKPAESRSSAFIIIASIQVTACTVRQAYKTDGEPDKHNAVRRNLGTGSCFPRSSPQELYLSMPARPAVLFRNVACFQWAVSVCKGAAQRGEAWPFLDWKESEWKRRPAMTLGALISTVR